GGRAVRAFFAIVVEDIAAAKGNDKLADLATRLEKALGELQAATLWFVQNGLANPNNAAAGSYAYMDLMGLVAWGWMWLKMAKASAAELANGTTDKAFHDAKLMTARFYAERVLPDAGALRRKIESGAESMMALPVEAF
ncbi:MAG: acyl-CoA dehydrogenase C-terminal domain-containing protein, partial [Alphaproteobacteria bacterium]|nr:acyl-CoA dehydrogenase C-terminal domain-containing protein [Alphaproteobacteria bacterium]